jgi:uracil phosphoribosyltransferase
MSGLRGITIVYAVNLFRTVFYVGAVDEELNDRGYILPGYGIWGCC